MKKRCLGSVEFLRSSYEIKKRQMFLKRDKCLSPGPPLRSAIVQLLPLRQVIALGGAKVAGVKPPWTFEFFEHFYTADVYAYFTTLPCLQVRIFIAGKLGKTPQAFLHFRW